MKVIGLNNKEYKLNLKESNGRSCSNGHKLARLLLKEVYPYDKVYEEVFLDGSNTALYLDFFIPSRKLAIEVQGAQHRKPSKFLNGGTTGFKKQLIRDDKKQQWCELNNFILVKLDDDRTTEWESALRNAFKADVD